MNKTSRKINPAVWCTYIVLLMLPEMLMLITIRNPSLSMGSRVGSVSGLCSVSPSLSSPGAICAKRLASSKGMAMSMSSSHGMNPP